jgi:FAD/FMN-containing dehydrogenase
MELAVGGGMHGFFSSTQGGMSLNLSKMNQVSVDSEAMTLTVEGGALWADVDEVASKHNLAVVGGTINFVGVGGLTLGGGYGYLSGAHGLVIDNLLSVELVLASGEIVTASETQNQDLFWAVRGAGASFAVATKFVFRAHEQKSLVWGGTLRFSKSQLREVVDFANHTLEISQGEASMMVGFSTMNATAEASVVAVVFYNGSEDAAKNFYAKLLALKPSFNDTAMVPYSAINSWHNASVAYGSRHANKGAALLTPVQPNFVESLFEEYQSFIENVHDANKTLVLFDFFGYKKIMQVPQTATAFANRGALVNVLFAPAWDNKFNDLSCQEWTLAMAKKTQVEMEKQRADRTDDMTLMAAGEYMNYDGTCTQQS